MLKIKTNEENSWKTYFLKKKTSYRLKSIEIIQEKKNKEATKICIIHLNYMKGEK